MVVFWDWEMSLCFLMREKKEGRREKRREGTTSIKVVKTIVQIRHSQYYVMKALPLMPHLIDNERTREIQPHFPFLTKKCSTFSHSFVYCNNIYFYQNYPFFTIWIIDNWTPSFIHSFIHATSKFQLSNPTKKNIVIFFLLGPVFIKFRRRNSICFFIPSYFKLLLVKKGSLSSSFLSSYLYFFFFSFLLKVGLLFLYA